MGHLVIYFKEYGFYRSGRKPGKKNGHFYVWQGFNPKNRILYLCIHSERYMKSKSKIKAKRKKDENEQIEYICWMLNAEKRILAMKTVHDVKTDRVTKTDERKTRRNEAKRKKN